MDPNWTELNYTTTYIYYTLIYMNIWWITRRHLDKSKKGKIIRLACSGGFVENSVSSKAL